jgi:hypothetical protein
LDNQAEMLMRHIERSDMRPCDINDNFIPNVMLPPPWDNRQFDDFSPFSGPEVFELADLLYQRNEMPEDQIDHLLQIWDYRIKTY